MRRQPWTVACVLIVTALIGGCGAESEPPSPQPSQTPVQASPNPALVELDARIADALAREGQLVRELAVAGTNASIGFVAARIATFAADELAWLDAHPGDACFRPAVEAFRAGMTSIADSADQFVAMARASTPPSEETGQAAGAALAEGTDGIGRAAALAREARADCR